MEITIKNNKDYTLIEAPELFNGEYPIQLKSIAFKLNNEGVKNILIDMKAVKEMSNTGMSSLLVTNRLCKKIGGKFVLYNLSNHLKRIIAVSQLNSVLKICDTDLQAIAYLKE